MNINAWSVDFDQKLMTHRCGLILRFRGVPGSTHFGFNPEWIPQELTGLQLARLMREGVEAYSQGLATAAAANRTLYAVAG